MASMESATPLAPSRRFLPRLYYGWVLVLTLSLTETTSFGILFYAFSVFIGPMHADLGWSRGAISLAFTIALLCSGLAGVVVGRWLDRHGPRLLMTVGSCAATALVLAWAAVDSLPIFYLIWAAIGIAMAAVLYEPAFAVVATWFSRQRNRALTVLTFLAGFASVIYIPLAGRLVETQGWRGALVILAIILGAGTIPFHALLLRRRPQDLGLLPDGVPMASTAAPSAQPHPRSPLPDTEPSVSTRAAIRGSAFWWLTVAFCLNSLGAVGMQVHLVPYLTDRGYALGFATGVAGLIGIMALPGRLIFTPLGGRFRRGLVTATIFLLQAAAILVLVQFSGTWAIYAYVALFGAGFGAVTPARASLVAEFYGPAHYGSIAGFLGLFLTAARAAAPVGAGAWFDLSGSYTPAFWALCLVSVASAGAVVIAERRAMRPRET